MSEKFKFDESLKDDEKKFGFSSKGETFKIAEGDNKFRVLTKGICLASHFQGKGQKSPICYGQDKGCQYHGYFDPANPQAGEHQKANLKWAMYVIDRKDNKIKLAFMPHTVIKAVAEYQKSEDYSFDGLPMPYDITLKAKGAGTKEVEYTLMPSPKQSELTEQEASDLEAKMPIDQLVEKLKNKQMSADSSNDDE